MCKINGKKLEEIRVNAGLSQRQLAKEIGISQYTISSYERGKTNPSDENVERICAILKINKEDIEIQKVNYRFLDGEGEITKKMRQSRGFKRMYLPVETEAWIAKQRTKTEEEEKEELETAMKFKMPFGGKVYIVIDPTIIHIPKWQRDTDMAKANDIAENFQDEKFDPIKVYIYNGKVYAADGGHRTVATIINKQKKVLVEVLACDEYNAVLIFLDQQTGRKAMSVCDMYRAGIKANIKEYIAFKEVFDKYNIQITADPVEIDNPLGKVTPSRTVLRLANRRQKELEKALSLILKLHWHGSTEKNAFTLRIINTLIKLYATCGNEVEGALLKNCKGATYFESKVAPIKSNAELYDFLVSEISK